MTTKQFVTFGKKLLPALPSFTIKESLIFKAPIGPILQGIYFDSSRFGKNQFQAQAFFLPLYVRQEQISFSFGRNLNNWDINDSDVVPKLISLIQNYALPFLEKANSIDSVAEELKKDLDVKSKLTNPYYLQAFAYSLIYLEEYDRADEALELHINLVGSTPAWRASLAEEAKALQGQLRKSSSTAKQQLLDWETESLKNLGLENFR